MHVTIAVPCKDPDGNDLKPDESYELPDAFAKQLVRDGWARRSAAAVAAADAEQPPPMSGKGSGTDAWLDYAKGKVAVPDGASREQIVALLKSVNAAVERAPEPPDPEPAHTDSDSPDAGANEKE